MLFEILRVALSRSCLTSARVSLLRRDGQVPPERRSGGQLVTSLGRSDEGIGTQSQRETRGMVTAEVVSDQASGSSSSSSSSSSSELIVPSSRIKLMYCAIATHVVVRDPADEMLG